jgi:hypothetical protein
MSFNIGEQVKLFRDTAKNIQYERNGVSSFIANVIKNNSWTITCGWKDKPDTRSLYKTINGHKFPYQIVVSAEAVYKL